MAEYGEMTFMAINYAFVEAEALLKQAKGVGRKRLEVGIREAYKHDALQAFDKMARVEDGVAQIVDNPPLIEHVPFSDAGTHPQRLVQDYQASVDPSLWTLIQRYTFADFARKVVGIGSVGTRCFVLLLMGASDRTRLFCS